MQVIKRDTIPAMRKILVDGREHDLGLLAHWRKEKFLNAVMPRDLDVSMAWVRLEKDQELEPHIHPVASLVVCCTGKVRSTGELETVMGEGDIMVIRPGERHGFIGDGENGFWGLSIQFESLALYEDLDSPLVTFVDQVPDFNSSIDAVTLLLQKNVNFSQQFADHPFFSHLDRGLFDRPEAKAKFYNYLYIWSNLYQKMLFCRAAFTDNSKFQLLARTHLDDEFNHDHQLKSRSDFKPVWDPILDATSHWFLTRMLSADDAEKTVLVHLVLETAADIFYQKFSRTAQQDKATSGHFDAHCEDELDVRHVKLGVDALREVPLRDHGALMEAQIRGWAVFNALFDRILELCLENEAVPAARAPQMESMAV